MAVMKPVTVEYNRMFESPIVYTTKEIDITAPDAEEQALLETYANDVVPDGMGFKTFSRYSSTNLMLLRAEAEQERDIATGKIIHGDDSESVFITSARETRSNRYRDVIKFLNGLIDKATGRGFTSIDIIHSVVSKYDDEVSTIGTVASSQLYRALEDEDFRKLLSVAGYATTESIAKGTYTISWE